MEHNDDYVPPAGARYEPTDVSAGLAAKFGIVLLVLALIIHVALWGLFKLLASRERQQQAAIAFPLAEGRGQQLRLPPLPRLQPLPVNDIAEFRAEEERLLRTFGWVDREAGIVRIPIEDAMRLTLERGLPSRPQESATLHLPVGSMPEDSSGGRTYERRTLAPLAQP